ncbi:ester cyclase [Nonomuraea ferruginea]
MEAQLAAWSAGDPAAVAATVASYADPDSGGVLSGDGLAGYAARVLGRFAGQRFLVERMVGGEDEVAVFWTLRADHRGAYLGMPATNGTVTVSGTDLVTLDHDGAHVRRSYDRLALAEALGYAARFVPAADETRQYGMSARVPTGRTERPGALVLTWLEIRDDAEAADVDLLSVEIVKSLRASRGFLGAATFDSRRPQVHAERLRPAGVAARGARPAAPAGHAPLLQERPVHPRAHQRLVPRLRAGLRPLPKLRRRRRDPRRRGVRVRVDPGGRRHAVMPEPPANHVETEVTGASMMDFTAEHRLGDSPRPAVVFMSALFAGGWIWEHPYRHLERVGLPVLRTNEAICALDRRVAGSIERLGDALLRACDEAGAARSSCAPTRWAAWSPSTWRAAAPTGCSASWSAARPASPPTLTSASASTGGGACGRSATSSASAWWPRCSTAGAACSPTTAWRRSATCCGGPSPW